jgi:hypothetical protein
MHQHYHQQLLRNQLAADSEEAILLALGSGGRRLPPPPAPIEFGPDIDLLALCETRESQGLGQTGSLPTTAK